MSGLQPAKPHAHWYTDADGHPRAVWHAHPYPIGDSHGHTVGLTFGDAHLPANYHLTPDAPANQHRRRASDKPE